jgi:aspartate dehydrogenase
MEYQERTKAGEVAPLRVGIFGLGTIGKTLAKAIDAGMPGLVLGGATARDTGKAQLWADQELTTSLPILSVDELARACDIVIETAPARLLPEIARPVLSAGKKLVVLSVGALLELPELAGLAEQHGGQILVPTGALLGLDAVTAAAEGEIHSVTMVTRKPVEGLLGAPFLEEQGINIMGITQPLQIFNGTAREAAKGFPANLNVAVALSLAGIGPDETKLEIWADPGITRNTHTISVDSDSASFTMTIQNIPTDNPKTGRITALSVQALLRKLSAPMRVGS